MNISSTQLDENAAVKLLPLLRMQYNLTQAQVSRGSNLALQTISELEQGKKRPRRFTILKLKIFFEQLEEAERMAE